MQALHNGTELCSAQVNLNIAPPRQAVAEPISEEPLDPLFRLDLGLHWVNAKTRDGDDRGLRWNSDRANLARVHARLTYGPQVRSTWLLGLKPPTSFQLRNSNSRIWQMLVGGGVAYSLELSEGVSAEPRVTTGLLLRGLTLDARNQGVKTSLFLMPGAALVLDLSDTMTAHASLDYELAPAWKPFDAKPNYWVLKGSGLRLGAGLSWRW